MKKTEDTVKWKLKVAYDTACNGYRDALLSLWELDWHYGYWNSDQPGTIYHYGEVHNLTMEEIIYIVDNDIEEAEVIVWEDYTLDALEFGFDTPNLMAWHRGCPRIPNATFDRLRQMKASLEKFVDDEKDRLKTQGESRGESKGQVHDSF